MDRPTHNQDSERTDLTKSFPISKRSIFRGALSYAFALAAVIAVLAVLDRLGSRVHHLEPKTFSLIGVAAILLAALAVLGKLIYEFVAYVTVHYYLEGGDLVLASGVFHSELKRLPNSMWDELAVKGTLADRLFGLRRLEVPHLNGSEMEFSIEGLKRRTAGEMHDFLVKRRAQGDLPQPAANRLGTKRQGAGTMADTFTPRSDDPQKQLERTKAEKEAIEKEAAKKQEELKQLQSKEQTVDELQKVEEEKKKAAEQLRATEEELKRAREKQQEEDRVNEAKKELRQKQHELELIREEKQVKRELQKTEQELAAEKARSETEQKNQSPVEGQPGQTFHRERSEGNTKRGW